MGGAVVTNVQVCWVCRFFWCVLVWGTCTYLVFWKGNSGWWYVLASLITEGDCKSYRSSEAALDAPGQKENAP